MPVVEIKRTFVGVAAGVVWDLLKEFQRYPDFCEHVTSVTIVRDDQDYKESEWVVLLNGNELRWSERDYVDNDDCRLSFEQISGDIAVWRGTLNVIGGPDSTAIYSVEFDLGVPALEGLLNPLGIQAVRTNCEQFLSAAARQLQVTSP